MLGDELDASRPTRGAWIEMSIGDEVDFIDFVVTHAGAWIEMILITALCAGKHRRPTRGAWIEMIIGQKTNPPNTSAPTRGWIEISADQRAAGVFKVVPYAGSGLKFTDAVASTVRVRRPTRAWIEITVESKNRCMSFSRGSGLKYASISEYVPGKGSSLRGERD